ncbi:aldose 1-epimerase family protein [Sphingomonas solaris]|uniref:Aldose 1-epimerase family protein n=2 Tax=Alterirhizorhabdus solaris TaxID=2529389 RepID=A0A558QRE1_9SPHN|nr:aldose 1-epimerase family protein [Sphingomonas solaris]
MIEIAGGGLSAGITALGAELHYLRDAEGRDLLWDGDPAFWTGRAPLLFPIVGGLNRDSYHLDGETYHLAKHGFARRSRFSVAGQTADHVIFRLEADAETRAVYPFDFRLDVRFTLHDGALTVTATVANRGDTPMPASFGFHPALRWPLPYGQPRDIHRIHFARPEPAPIRRLDGDGLVSPTPRPTPIEGDVLPLADALFTDDAIILDTPASRAVTYGAPAGPQLAIDFPDMPMLGIWTKPGAGYICIEPWHGIADPAGFLGDIFAKPGILTFAPGEENAFTMHIALQKPG